MRNIIQWEVDVVLWILKIIIIVLWLIDFLLEMDLLSGKKNKMKMVKKWRNIISFWFSFFIGILLIYIFNPWKKIPMTNATKMTLFVFGIIYIINLNWKYHFGTVLLKVAS